MEPRPGYEPGFAASSGGNNTKGNTDKINIDKEPTSVTEKDNTQVEVQVNDEKLDASGASPSKTRRVQPWTFNINQPNLVIDLDEDLDLDGVQTNDAAGSADALNMAPPLDTTFLGSEDEGDDEDTDVLVSPLEDTNRHTKRRLMPWSATQSLWESSRHYTAHSTHLHGLAIS